MTGEVTARVWLHLDAAQRDEAWRLYARLFTPLRTQALQTHLMPWFQFAEYAAEPAVEKHIAYLGQRMVGLAMITNDLRAWPLIEPDFVAERWPREYETRQCWYVGFVCAQARGQAEVFGRLLRSMTEGRRDGGQFFMDFCKSNLDRGLLEHCVATLRQFDPRVRAHRVDVQEYWRMAFRGDEARDD